MEESIRKDFERAKSLLDSDFKSSIPILIDLIKRDNLDELEDGAKIQEQAIYLLGETYMKNGMAEELKGLIETIRPIIGGLPKARVAKIIRSLLDMMSKIPGTERMQEELCLDCIEWCIEEKRTFLRHRITARLAMVYLSSSQFVKGLEYVEKLIKEVKKVDDKILLVEVYLIESKLEYRIRNLPRSKASLTAARTNANSIHCPPLLQADIDLQSGIILADEGDFKTSFSYFYEAFEAFNIANDDRALQSLKYMLLSKIMSKQTSNLASLLSGKNKVKFQTREVEALKIVASCCENRSLSMFEDALKTYETELSSDIVVHKHISDLYESLMEQNILRILESYSHIEISQLAIFLNLPSERVYSKIIDMILNKTIQGNIDQRSGVLTIFDENRNSGLMIPELISTFDHLSNVVDVLYEKATKAI
ncbi:26S proteasome regulatory subunit Rpn6-like and PINT domain-containing protein [Cryptosporidium canis]|uniref:26S proteasome regulatory subunit Rpn6-like and PINT domain-containing protein n=1 Tax=Cryptosporidium canis TaxID=195482 RepID=A0ABQ8P843_9CRYT|nr:26S proteasome regulatory subunit Rpn6-like and PINT domain-containing protein [Cryptosporidium canis]KAJ1612109.1 26S proteasome regulatory subunit Rpn6-like and PINT domain-containing protein [Cryptosporidium canis]